MAKRDRERRPARRKPDLEPKPTILIVSEGAVTEPEYFEQFADACQNSRVKIETLGGAGIPITIVTAARDRKKRAADRAVQERDDFLAYDEVWCVFDVDDHPNVENALEMARANQLEVAMSNPCVELWLYLHFADQPGMQQRGAMMDYLQRYIATYGHANKHVDFERFKNSYQLARDRAKRLDERAADVGEAGRNPTTGLWRLTESIRGKTPLPLE